MSVLLLLSATSNGFNVRVLLDGRAQDEQKNVSGNMAQMCLIIIAGIFDLRFILHRYC